MGERVDRPGRTSGGSTARRRPSSRRGRALVIAALTGLAGCGSDAGTSAVTAGPSSTAAAATTTPAPAPAATGATLAAPPSSTAVPPATQSPAASTTAPAPTSSDGPSQSASDAERNGVLPAVAELPLDDRVHVIAELPAGDGRAWVLSELPGSTVQRFIDDHGGRLGDNQPDTPGASASDYGELLLLNGDGAIVRAWPMPGAPPNWLAAGNDRIYAGHNGDGGLPDSTLARIDPASFAATVVVIPAQLDGTASGWPPAWHVATGDDVFDYRGVIGFGSGGMTGTKAVSPLGDVVVALGPIDGLINRVSGTGG